MPESLSATSSSSSSVAGPCIFFFSFEVSVKSNAIFAVISVQMFPLDDLNYHFRGTLRQSYKSLPKKLENLRDGEIKTWCKVPTSSMFSRLVSIAVWPPVAKIRIDRIGLYYSKQ